MLYLKAYQVNGVNDLDSFIDNFSEEENIRIIIVEGNDKTQADFVVVKIIRNTAAECEHEILGQLSDGIFENIRFSYVDDLYEFEI